MRLILHRDTSNKLQKIPYPAMQISGLADAEELILYTGEGSILLSRKDFSAREAIKTISLLDQAATCLVSQLVTASNAAAGRTEGWEEPLDEFDEEIIANLVDCGADPEGLRLLLRLEEAEDE